MTTQNQAVEAAVEQLMELHDDAAEARHTQGAPEYNSKSSQARKALAAAIRAMLVSAITQQPVQPAGKETCQTCEALARAVMMDQVGRAA